MAPFAKSRVKMQHAMEALNRTYERLGTCITADKLKLRLRQWKNLTSTETFLSSHCRSSHWRKSIRLQLIRLKLLIMAPSNCGNWYSVKVIYYYTTYKQVCWLESETNPHCTEVHEPILFSLCLNWTPNTETAILMMHKIYIYRTTIRYI